MSFSMFSLFRALSLLSCDPTRNGEQWESQRKPISKFMMVPRKLGEYHEAFNEVTFDLVDFIRRERQKEDNLYRDVPGVMNRWSFECKRTYCI